MWGGGGLDGVVEFDVGDFGAANDFFLGFGRELVPGVEIVKILLDDDVASAGESGIFLADEDGIGGRAACGIFGAVHEAEQIAFIEVAEAVDFVGSGDGASKASHDLRRELKTEIHALGADVKDQVAGCGNSVARAGADFAEGMKFGRAWGAEEAVPGVGTQAHDAGERVFEGTKTDGAQKRGEIGA